MVFEYLLFAMAAFWVGFLLGKHLGRKEGREEGKALAPLMLREQSFAQGYCALCQAARLPSAQRPPGSLSS
jgi:hypothetical protein